MMILISVFTLGVLIFVHELGHFLLAKLNGVGVLEFAIGFGPVVWAKRIGETSYSLRIIPLGGYVKMVGDDPRDLEAVESKAGADAAGEPPQEEIKPDPEIERLMKDHTKWFLEKGFFPKASIVLAGPGFNYIFAILLAIVSAITYGKAVPTELPLLGDAIKGYPADRAGLKGGDLIKAIDGKPISTWIDMAKTIGASGGKELTLHIERKNGEGAEAKTEEQDIKVVGEPESSEVKYLENAPEDAKASKAYKIGIVPETTRESVTFKEALSSGVSHVWYISVLTVRGLQGMIGGSISAKNIAGPIFIFNEAARSAKKGLEHLFDFMIFLSVSLAVLNLLPIPILDGGHILFFLIEALKGKPVSMKTQQWANHFGMAVLLLLMIFAVGNDIVRLVK